MLFAKHYCSLSIKETTSQAADQERFPKEDLVSALMKL